VVEVRIDHVTGDRFQHGTKLLRWRDDKALRQCIFEQIAAPIADVRAEEIRATSARLVPSMLLQNCHCEERSDAAISVRYQTGSKLPRRCTPRSDNPVRLKPLEPIPPPR
jgi:hypothetical protein